MNDALGLQQVLVFQGENDPALLNRIEMLRQDVWREFIDTKLAVKRFALDKFDYEAWHIAYLNESRVIASGRLIITDCQFGVPDDCSFRPYHGLMDYPVGILNRLVVDRAYRGMGMATSINKDRIGLAGDHGVTDLWVEVQSHRVTFMEQLGFVDLGSSLDTSIDGDWRIMRRST